MLSQKTKKGNSMHGFSESNHSLILQTATQEFLSHGFAGASMRTIAKNAHLTTGALYRHFANKAELFDAIVNPVRDEVVQRFQCQTETYIDLLPTEGMQVMWERGAQGWGMQEFALYIYEHLDLFKLLFLASADMAQAFFHTLIDLESSCTNRYLLAAKEQGLPVHIPSEREMHLLCNAQFSLLFELVFHEIPKEEGLGYVQTMDRFFIAGWKEIIMHSPSGEVE